MFLISSTPIDPDELKRQVSTPEAGAYVAFEGWVRENNEGKEVTALEYEAYEELAVKEGSKILNEAKKFDILKAQCVHRVGRLAIGDMAVMVAVSSAHRKEAFEACEFIINEIKKRVPIWKREYYADDTTSWVNCSHGNSSASESSKRDEEHSHAETECSKHEHKDKKTAAAKGAKS